MHLGDELYLPDDLWHRYRTIATASARRWLRDKWLAEDVAQDALIELWRQYPAGMPAGAEIAWLRAVARNKAVTLNRRRFREGATASATGIGSTIYTDFGDLNRMFAELPVEQRQAIVLKCIAGLSVDEIAKATGVPAGTIRTRLQRGRARLRGGVNIILAN